MVAILLPVNKHKQEDTHANPKRTCPHYSDKTESVVASCFYSHALPPVEYDWVFRVLPFVYLDANYFPTFHVLAHKAQHLHKMHAHRARPRQREKGRPEDTLWTVACGILITLIPLFP